MIFDRGDIGMCSFGVIRDEKSAERRPGGRRRHDRCTRHIF
jgi:hypothetical protein